MGKVIRKRLGGKLAQSEEHNEQQPNNAHFVSVNRQLKPRAKT